MNRKYRLAAQRRAAHHRARRARRAHGTIRRRDPELLDLLRAAAAIARPRPEPDPSGRWTVRDAARGRGSVPARRP